MTVHDAKKYIPHLGRDFKIAKDEVHFHTMTKEEYEALIARIEALEAAQA